MLTVKLFPPERTQLEKSPESKDVFSPAAATDVEYVPCLPERIDDAEKASAAKKVERHTQTLYYKY